MRVNEICHSIRPRNVRSLENACKQDIWQGTGDAPLEGAVPGGESCIVEVSRFPQQCRKALCRVEECDRIGEAIRSRIPFCELCGKWRLEIRGAVCHDNADSEGNPMERAGRPPGPWIRAVKKALEEAILDGSIPPHDPNAERQWLDEHGDLLQDHPV